MQERELASKHQVLLEKQPQTSRAEEGAVRGRGETCHRQLPGGMAQWAIRDVLNASFG